MIQDFGDGAGGDGGGGGFGDSASGDGDGDDKSKPAHFLTYPAEDFLSECTNGDGPWALED